MSCGYYPVTRMHYVGMKLFSSELLLATVRRVLDEPAKNLIVA
jgi:hypothetical protein